ncbi:MFS family permease [Rhodoblastus acidophilus]|uniref:MFS transporter n=1 Tax=Rhodoblastus acidophilus TaxID=1074 RepID=UPI0016118B79|nr:MFS transporter [Rhodoblastus acidophilus]MCW2285051.1 MFS family permease [Rhodoblastus acidophilus]MCW2334091.1 MFS family permease [Rhodoblastus acidophilus]
MSAFDAHTKKSLAAAIACISIVGIGLSLVIPLLALRLEAAGFAAHDNGAQIAVSGLATLIGAPLAPLLARRFGLRVLLGAAIALAVASLAAFALTFDYRAWLAIRFAFGLALTVVFVLSEFWISAAAPRGQRGLVLGIYATFLALGFAAGPALLSVTGAEGALPFAVAAAITAAAGLPVVWAGEPETGFDSPGRPRLGPIFKAAPVAVTTALLFGCIETGLNGLLPVFGLRSGFSQAWATFQLTLFALGNVVFPVPIGMLADRTGKIRLLVWFSLIGLFGALMLPGLADNRAVYAFGLFLWGGVVGGLYTVGLAALAERFHGERLAAANAAYIMMYALGMILGPPLLGVGLDFAPRGLFDALGVCFVAYLGLILFFHGPFARKT